MIGIVVNAKRFAIPVRVSQGDWYQVLLNVDTPVVTQCKRMIVGRVVDWAPEVDNLEAVLQQLWNVLSGKMAVNASDGRLGSLVDVHRRDRLTLVRAIVDLSWAATADSCEKCLVSLPVHYTESRYTYCDQMAECDLRLSIA